MASAAAASLLKPISMAADKTSCVLTSIPTPLFTSSSSKTLQKSKFLKISSTPFTSKPCNLKWVCAKNRNLSVLVPFVAQTSDWAQPQQGEEVVEEEEDTVAETVVEDGDDENGGGEMLFSENSEDAKIFVGNLPYDVDSEALAQLFNQAGVVEIAEVIYNRETDQSRGFGFVTMSTVEEAEKAVEKFSQHEINGRFLTVNKAGPRGSPRPERTPRTFAASNRMYVGNLAWQVDDSRLEQVFSEHGKVVDARVVYDRETQRSRGFGFVTMSNETEVNDAIAALDGQSLDGRAIKVNVAEERPRRNSF